VPPEQPPLAGLAVLIVEDARIRAHDDPRVARVPVVAVTGRLEAAEQIFRAGFSAHLFKPINPDRLCAAIELFASTGARHLRAAS
jgi:CheY-like chemotaxis protein